ncbi:hypothetical protein GOP47_0028864 [Adiantum capillus-veneris]|nr:hypothetical protein GOP47_0028864 [Adiantum capillus-veneris]
MATKPPWVRQELRRRSLAMVGKQGGLGVSNNATESRASGLDEQVESVERPASTIDSDNERHDDVALVSLLKACTKQKDLYQGNKLHAVIVRRGLLDINIIVGNSLVNFYSKCGVLGTARRILDELPGWDVVSWTILIAGFCEHGQFEDALNCLDKMRFEGLSPDPVTLASILKACGSARDRKRGEHVHADIVKEGWLEEDVVLGSALLDMYAKCDALAKAQQVFKELPGQDRVSWNSLIAGYTQCGYSEEALCYFQQSLLEGLTPDLATYTCVLKACGSLGAIEHGKRLHAQIAGKRLLGKDFILGSALVDMYAKCGALVHAQQVFDELPNRNEVSWTSLITGFCQHMNGEEALACFERMKQDGFSPDRVTFACILRACGNAGAAEKGKEIHGEILRLGLLGKDTVLGNALVDMYGKCGALTKAQEVFDSLPDCNLVSWNALIAGYCQHGHGEEALTCFEQLKCSGLSPDYITYACILKACGSTGALEEGQEVHAEVARKALLGHGPVLGNALVDMYSKCGALDMAYEVFGELPVRDVVSWNALITGYCENGFGEQGLDLFEWMKDEGLHPNAVTFACILKACGNIRAAGPGEEIHNDVVKKGLLESANILGNTLVAMYGKCGAHGKAHKLFDQLPSQDVVAWNALISAHCKFGHCKEALILYDLMNYNSITPDAVTFSCILKACSMLGATEKVKEFFTDITSKGLLQDCLILGNALVNMYAKCNVLGRAQYVFDKLQVRNEVSWNALFAGYCKHGLHEEALNCFEHLKYEGHAAAWEQPTRDRCTLALGSRSLNYGIMPTSKPHIGMVELFSHAGHLDKAMEVMKGLPSFFYLPAQLSNHDCWKGPAAVG